MTIHERIYLDHNATTPLKPEVRDVMLETLGCTGNPSSIHKAGREAKRMIEEARSAILRYVNAGTKAVLVFTSGATEANNLVLKGSGCERLFVSAIEHPSVLNAAAEKEIIPVLPSGLIDIEALDRMLASNDRSALISVMTVNNETGVIQPIDKVVALAKKYGALVHTDAVQAAGRLPLDIQSLGVDYLTLSAHKIGGPQGAGCLILSNCVSVAPQMHGGNQEKNMRAGTENLAGIRGFAAACTLAARDIEKMQSLATLRDELEAVLQRIAPELIIFGKESPRVGNTCLFALEGAPSETQLIALDLAGICVSNGSACASGTVKTSHVLRAMGVDEALAATSLRVSLGWNTTPAEIDAFLKKWEELYTRIKGKMKK